MGGPSGRPFSPQCHPEPPPARPGQSTRRVSSPGERGRQPRAAREGIPGPPGSGEGRLAVTGFLQGRAGDAEVGRDLDDLIIEFFTAAPSNLVFLSGEADLARGSWPGLGVANQVRPRKEAHSAYWQFHTIGPCTLMLRTRLGRLFLTPRWCCQSNRLPQG
jgi:hypothetical protein